MLRVKNPQKYRVFYCFILSLPSSFYSVYFMRPAVKGPLMGEKTVPEQVFGEFFLIIFTNKIGTGAEEGHKQATSVG